MNNLKNYLETIRFEDAKQKISKVSSELFKRHLKFFNYQSRLNGLLLGDVQSGKTGQMFGIIAAAVDNNFDLFLMLTTDNVRLQEQTFERALDSFPDFCVCSENDEVRFMRNKMRKPVVIILKKNSSILKKWRNHLRDSNLLSGRSLFLLDDEADAASLNAKVNQNEYTAINRHIKDIRKACSSCVYLQVTATPQAILLQSGDSEFKPSFSIYFEPGKSYLGGDFFFSKPEPYCIIETEETEIQTVANPDSEEDLWLRRALLSFLIVCAHFKLTNYSKTANFLIHPSVKTNIHKVVAEKIKKILRDIIQGIDDDNVEIKDDIKSERNNLYSTKPEIKPFGDIYECIRNMLFNSEIKVYTMNSKSNADINVETGFNIVVGGNILGRGVTFPNLQTVYYSRTAKTPQADTYWQHCRMFGYDRDRGLIRLFLPFSIFKVFQELNESYKALVKQISINGIDNTVLLYPHKIKPTRSGVIHSQKQTLIVGGVNYFAAFPKDNNLKHLDEILLPLSKNKGIQECEIAVLIEILSFVESEDKTNNDWNQKNYIGAAKMAASRQNIKRAKIIVSVGHKISKNKRTMLSQAHRAEIDKYDYDIFLVMYRLTGDRELGWNGKPLWMPNIKFPSNFLFYGME